MRWGLLPQADRVHTGAVRRSAPGLKILGRAEIFEAEQAREWVERVRVPDYAAIIERVFAIRMEAFDWNCQQHITPRFTTEEIQVAGISPSRATARKERGSMTTNISRRRFTATIGLAAGSLLAGSRKILADIRGNDTKSGIVPTMVNAAAQAKITVQPIRRNISVLEGSGGNIAVLTGRDGKLLVDAGFAVSREGISRALASINADPIQHLINTHWHADHTDGNAWLHSEGAAIVAHENTRKRLAVDTRVEGWNWTFPAVPAGALPAKVFVADHKLHLNDTSISLKYYGPAHTDSDVSVLFGEADVLHVADTWWNGVYPFIDYSTGGSIDGQIQAAEKNLALATDKMIIIPGHGPVGNKSDLAQFRDMLVTIRGNVAALKKQGRSFKEIVAAKPTLAYDAKWGQFLITPSAFTASVYMGV